MWFISSPLAKQCWDAAACCSLSCQTHIEAPKLANYLAGFFLFAMWAQFSFEEKSLASFNFSFLHLPCSYMHIFYLKDLVFFSGCFFFLLFFSLHVNLFFTPLERTNILHYLLSRPSRVSESAVFSALLLCLIHYWMNTSRMKVWVSNPNCSEYTLSQRSQQNTSVTFLSPGSSRSQRILQTVSLLKANAGHTLIFWMI